MSSDNNALQALCVIVAVCVFGWAAVFIPIAIARATVTWTARVWTDEVDRHRAARQQ